MPISIPSPDSLGLVLPQADKQITSYTGGIAQQAAESIGTATAAFGQDVEKTASVVQDAQDKVASTAAFTNFINKKLDIDKSFETDQDFATAPQRYSDALKQAAMDSGQSIATVPAQTDFQEKVARYREYAENQIVQRSFRQKQDTDKGNLLTGLDSTLDAASRAPDARTRMDGYNNASQMLNAAVAAGTITHEEGARLSMAMREQAAEKLATTMADSDPGGLRHILQGGPIGEGLPADLAGAIHSASARNGADEDVLTRTAQIEGPKHGEVGNGGGDFQFNHDTATRFALTDVHNTGAAADAAARLQVENRNSLTAALGRPPTGAELYLAHQQGAAGAAALIKNPDETAVNAITSANGHNAGQAVSAITGNGGSGGMKASDFVNLWAQKYNAMPGLGTATALMTPTPPIPPGTDTAPAPATLGSVQVAGPGAPTQPTTAAAAAQPTAAPSTNPTVNTDVALPKLNTGTPLDFLPPDKQAAFLRLATDREREQQRAAYVDQEHAAAMKERALRDGSNDAESRAIADINGVGDNKDITAAQIADPKGPYNGLMPDAKLRLISTLEQKGRETGGNIADYGPGYSQAYNAIFAKADDPSRINDLSDIFKRSAPGGDLSLSGASKLAAVFQAVQKDPNAAGMHATAASMLTYAKTHLSFQEDTGPVKIRDPKGEDIYNAQFVPQFEAGLEEVRKSGKPQDVRDYLSKPNIDKMISGLRSQADMAKDRMVATGQEFPGEDDKPGAPLPVPPDDILPPAQKDVPGETTPAVTKPVQINSGEWYNIINTPPKAQNGSPYTHDAWSQALTMLLKDPSDKMIKHFDEYFGASGFSGAEIVKRLTAPTSKVSQQAAEPAAPVWMQ